MEKLGKSTWALKKHCSTLYLDWFAYSTVHGFAIKLVLLGNLLNKFGDIKHYIAPVSINIEIGFP